MTIPRRRVRIGILLGSNRSTGNGVGIRSWFRQQHLERSIAARAVATAITDIDIELVDLFPFPAGPAGSSAALGPIVSDVIPAAHRSSADYADAATRAWSERVSACSAFVIITPQHNWSVPGELKTALDHLYHEWRGKPVALITYGGHGGVKCGEHLRQILGGGLKMRVVTEELAITLPDANIRGTERFPQQWIGSGNCSFLAQYDDAANKLCESLLNAIE